MNHDPYYWGRPTDEMYGQYNHDIANAHRNHYSEATTTLDHAGNPKMNTTQPIVTGTSVVSMKYDNGVIIAADNLASYGSLLRFHGVERLIRIGTNTIVGVSGDISDMQYIEKLLDDLQVENNYDNSYLDNEELLQPSYVFEYLANVMYNRRSKMNPLWNAIIVAGLEKNTTPFLRYVNLLGVQYGSPSLATGFGSHLAIPLLRKVVDDEKDVEKVNLETAKKTILDCMKVLYYRDTRSSKKFSLAVIDKDLGLIYEPEREVEQMSWKFAKDIKGYGTQKI
ncbi:Proteasome subunit beta type-7 [Hanseniaspora vineae]